MAYSYDRRIQGAATFSPAQQQVLEEIRQGKLRSEQSNTRKGLVIQKLIEKGVVGYKDKSVEKGMKTFHGRWLPSFVIWVGLHVIEPKMAAKTKDKLPGGLADKGPPKDVDPKQVEKGLKVEREHTDDPDIAREIVYDHLTEDPRYYDKLEKIEKEAYSYDRR